MVEMQRLKKKHFKSIMNRNQILSLDSSNFEDENWKMAIKYFEDRFNRRYFDQLDILINHKDLKIKYNCGFLVTTIDCILIETIEQFYEGEDEIKLSNQSFFNFFSRNEKLNQLFENAKDAGIFLGIIRSGLVHQAMTKKSSLINVKKKDLVIEWIDVKNKKQGFEINRTNFHNCVIEEYKKYLEILNSGKEIELLNRFKRKLLYIVS
ncbi:hypothetical protein [Flavobacterium sp.]|uniref:hypothetical protein n=1 Tax=Flavobacterium sp. TaxID=239 RepID=UPI0039E4A19D